MHIAIFLNRHFHDDVMMMQYYETECFEGGSGGGIMTSYQIAYSYRKVHCGVAKELAPGFQLLPATGQPSTSVQQ